MAPFCLLAFVYRTHLVGLGNPIYRTIADRKRERHPFERLKSIHRPLNRVPLQSAFIVDRTCQQHTNILHRWIYLFLSLCLSLSLRGHIYVKKSLLFVLFANQCYRLHTMFADSACIVDSFPSTTVI